MRIGILTYHCQPNFGAQLQAISTVGYLRRQGHEPVVLHWYAADLEAMYERRTSAQQLACHEAFTQQVLPLSPKCSTLDQLVAAVDALHLDAIVAGSDALFKFAPVKNRRHFDFRKLRYHENYRPLSCELLDENPFFGSLLHRLSHPIPASVYAVSSQNCPYQDMTSQEKRQMASAMSAYRMISVRDAWTQQMVQWVTRRREVPIYPDPVFAFNQNCHLPIPTEDEILRKFQLNENYVLLSFRGKRCDAAYVKQIAHEVSRRGLQPVALPMPEALFDAGIVKQIPLPLTPLDWYALIQHSQGYIGERMHPIVVCLHNAVPFYSFDEYGTLTRDSRFSSQKHYLPTSSKTYLIVSAAGLLSNLYSYQGGDPLPLPATVVDRLLSFDRPRCLAFAQQQQQRYNQGMEQILLSLQRANDSK